MTRTTTGFDPAHGFAFPNAFVDTAFTFPGGKKLTTRGRCGGMAYLALDYFHADIPVPYLPAAHFAPGRVPPDTHWAADAIRERLFDSFKTLSALKFVAWSMLSDDVVERETTRDELPRVLKALDEGHPVPLGLVVARSALRVGDNHQVVAYGYSRAGDAVTLLLHDNNTPGREVTLSRRPDGAWDASNRQTWRGFFVQDYRPQAPRKRTTRPADPAATVTAGAQVALAHVWTGLVLGSSTTRWTHPGSSGGQQVTCVRLAGSENQWRAVPVGGDARSALRDQDLVRLEHVKTGAVLTSRAGVKSPVTGQQEVACSPRSADRASRADRADEWRVEVDGGGLWRAGARIRLVHVPTNGALHSHERSDERLTGGRQEVTAFAGRDDNDWWTVLELRP